jgi:hypothetical protein
MAPFEKETSNPARLVGSRRESSFRTDILCEAEEQVWNVQSRSIGREPKRVKFSYWHTLWGRRASSSIRDQLKGAQSQQESYVNPPRSNLWSSRIHLFMCHAILRNAVFTCQRKTYIKVHFPLQAPLPQACLLLLYFTLKKFRNCHLIKYF